MSVSLCRVVARRGADPVVGQSLRLGAVFSGQRNFCTDTKSKLRVVALNAARLDYDGRINWERITDHADLTRHAISESAADILSRVAGADIVLNKEFPLRGDLIRDFPASVKLIAEAGTGYNNIDVDACLEKGIAICNCPTYTLEAMAHMTITLIMALSCSLAPQIKALARGDRRFHKQCHLGSLPHFELQGKTLGIIGGLGRIAQRISQISLGLGMKVVISDRPSNNTPLGLRRDTGVEVVSFEDLLRRSDFISTMCTLNSQTTGLVDAAAFAKMKPTAFIINTARGSIIDQDALIDALRQKTIAGAALDVFGPGSAPPPALDDDSPLYEVFNELDNVILTPHIGWQRLEARQRLVDMCADNIAAFARGDAMEVDLKTGLTSWDTSLTSWT